MKEYETKLNERTSEGSWTFPAKHTWETIKEKEKKTCQKTSWDFKKKNGFDLVLSVFEDYIASLFC